MKKAYTIDQQIVIKQVKNEQIRIYATSDR